MKFQGELEIDQERGAVYFRTEDGATLLRIVRLPFVPGRLTMIDVTFGSGMSISVPWVNDENQPGIHARVKYEEGTGHAGEASETQRDDKRR
jgi:hypothetical protein